VSEAARYPRGNVLIDVAALSLNDADRKRLLHPATAGVVLFAENFSEREQLAKLVLEIRRLRNPRLLIAVDQEGGRVQRFRDGFVRLPAARRYGDVYDNDPAEGCRLAELGGWVMAAELLAVGIDLSFAPVLDVAAVHSNVIGDRAFHHDAAAVAELAVAFARGMRLAGMATVGKHFPGHGGVAEDTHYESPVDVRSLAQLRDSDFVPYLAALRHGVLDGVMTTHVQFPDIEPCIGTFSRKFLRQLLREELDFHGPVFTDDLHMAGVADHATPVERAQQALSAGCDYLLMCRDTDAADSMLDAVQKFKLSGQFPQLSEDRLAGIVETRTRKHPAKEFSVHWQRALDQLQRI